MSKEDIDDIEESEELKIAPPPPRAVTEDFHLWVALGALFDDNEALSHRLENEENRIRDLRATIVAASRKNFILERELNEIDEKIKLLIKNRISVQEVMMHSAGGETKHEGNENENASPLKNKRTLYEDLFYLLQSKPKYLSDLSRKCSAKEIPLFVQTVVFDMYGDQYDTREERLLLSLFRRVLKTDIDNCPDKGSLLRANTAITQMLSAYARRGQGLAILREILEAPLKEITGNPDLNLEINPTKVYQFIIQEQETNTGKSSELKKDVTDDEAARHPFVQKMIEERLSKLVYYCNMILSRIVTGVDSIPYGMRWICKQLAELFKSRFPDADRYQIGSVIGGYIYLRFFNPVIVTPDALNFIQIKPNRVIRRNLVLIAKVLQNLSNGLLFGDKEVYMKKLNPFIQEKSSLLQEYFEKIKQVDDLEDELAVDKYLEHTNVRLNLINITYNQIFLIHSLLAKHVDQLDLGADDAVRQIIQKLGPAPEEVKRDENRTVALKLIDRRTQRMSTTSNDFLEHSHALHPMRELLNPLFLQARTLLLCILRRLPHSPPSSHASSTTSLYAFLDDERRKASEKNDLSLSEHITNILAMLTALNNMGLLEKFSDNPNDNYNMFLWKIATESMARLKKVDGLMKKAKRIEDAYKTISNHHNYLLSRLELYKIYLENCRAGAASGMKPPGPTGKKEKFDTKKPNDKKFSHTELEEKGIIMKLNMDVPKAMLKKCYYHFTMEKPGRFKVEVRLKKGIEINILNKPVELQLEDLLQKQEHGEQSMQMEEVTLNINLLIHLLNTNFMK